MSSVHRAAQDGFSRAADAYERGRPGYPPELVGWLVRQLGLGPGRVVCDLASGTGKLTRGLASTGARVVAVEPVGEMLVKLRGAVEEAGAVQGVAEAIPLASGSVDVAAVAQAFHWFAGAESLAEIRRVLRPGGRLALVWNRRDQRSPLQQAVSEIIEPYRGDAPTFASGRWRDAVDADPRLGAVAEYRTPTAQIVDADGLVDRVGSTSIIAALPDEERREVLDRVRALAEDRPERFDLPYVSEAYVYEVA